MKKKEEVQLLKFICPLKLHNDSKLLLQLFIQDMANKMRKAELKYGRANEWRNADWGEKCLKDFLIHVDKGDPLDVAIYCAFMSYHGWKTILPHQQDKKAAEIILTKAFKRVLKMIRVNRPTRKKANQEWRDSSATADLICAETHAKAIARATKRKESYADENTQPDYQPTSESIEAPGVEQPPVPSN